MSRRRAATAALLSLFVPGLGHGYLRMWVRALAWFSLAFAVVALLVPESAYAAAETGGFAAAVEASTSLPVQVYVGVFGVRVVSALDAGLIGFRGQHAHTPGGNEGESCPNCGGELDADLDFCPWCTTRLEWVSREESEAETDA